MQPLKLIHCFGCLDYSSLYIVGLIQYDPVPFISINSLLFNVTALGKLMRYCAISRQDDLILMEACSIFFAIC